MSTQFSQVTRDTRARTRGTVVTRVHAIGAVASGALAVGALAIGALAIGRLVIGRARIRRLEIDELVVQKLLVTGSISPDPTPHPGHDE